jgi:hypothetical protein
MQHLKQYGNIRDLSFYKIDPLLLTYNSVMSDLYKVEKAIEVDLHMFQLYSFIQADIELSKEIQGRLYVAFLDTQSYSLSLLLSEEKIQNGIIKQSLLDELSTAFFDILQPIFGHMGTEKGVDGVESIKHEKNFLEVDNSFLCNELHQRIFNQGKERMFPVSLSIRSYNMGKMFHTKETCRNVNFYDLIREVI